MNDAIVINAMDAKVEPSEATIDASDARINELDAGIVRQDMYDVSVIRADFPVLGREVNGYPLAYLDNAASAQKPSSVIRCVADCYAEDYANVHRGLHHLSNIMTDRYEQVRSTIATFLNADSAEEILYTTGATEGINLVAHAWAMPNLEAGDEILLTTMEHHANIVPWHFLRERSGIRLVWVDPDEQGALDPQRVIDAIGPRTRLIAITHASNVLGTRVDLASICEAAARHGIPVLADGAQAAVHGPVDVQALGVDFYAITGHKLYGPSASGALYVRRDRLATMQPFKGGGNMIREVAKDDVSYASGVQRFESGTPAIVPMIGLGVALDYLSDIGMTRIAAHEAALGDYANEQFSRRDWLRVHGHAAGKCAIFSFSLSGAGHAHDISTILDKRGIAVRAGHHCAQPLMTLLDEPATCRASFALYNTFDEIDRLMSALEFCHELFA